MMIFSCANPQMDLSTGGKIFARPGGEDCFIFFFSSTRTAKLYQERAYLVPKA